MIYEIKPSPFRGYDVFAWRIKYDGSNGHRRLYGWFPDLASAQAAIA